MPNTVEVYLTIHPMTLDTPTGNMCNVATVILI